jgi:hypothetical protein
MIKTQHPLDGWFVVLTRHLPDLKENARHGQIRVVLQTSESVGDCALIDWFDCGEHIQSQLVPLTELAKPRSDDEIFYKLFPSKEAKEAHYAWGHRPGSTPLRSVP